MAEMNLKQITDQLNQAFSGNGRSLVFWFDDHAEFVEDIKDLSLENAEIYFLENNNQFKTKHFLECVDTKTNYLIYAPYPKPNVRENHLADTILYSKEFHADRASLLVNDLGIDEQYKDVIRRHIKFFGAKDRTRKFYNLSIDRYDPQTIVLGMMSVLSRSQIPSLEKVLQGILLFDDIEDSTILREFAKYDLVGPFWEQIYLMFGYEDENPTLQKLLISLFVTYMHQAVKADLPIQWQNLVSVKAGSIIAFIDNMMHNHIYSEKFDNLSNIIYKYLKLEDIFAQMNVEDLTECNIFAGVEHLIIRWMVERLLNEDTGAKLNDMTIPEVCQARRRQHFGDMMRDRYWLVEHAWHLIAKGIYTPRSGLNNVLNYYLDEGYQLDQHYRYFYYHKDNDTYREDDKVLEQLLEKLRDLVELLYTNAFLNPLAVNWNQEFVANQGKTELIYQSRFYDHFVRPKNEKTAVIISDAFRYEVGQTLVERLESDPKCEPRSHAMQAIIPSFTRFCMATLLPHSSLSIDVKYEIRVDGKVTDNLKQRETVLQSYEPNSRCVQFDDIYDMKVAELRNVFNGQNVVYIYHNQIDARGDKLTTENEVFNACHEAVCEIHDLIRKLSSGVSMTRFIITADHGFIYKRDKLEESDKIIRSDVSAGRVERRFILANRPAEIEGVLSLPLNNILKNDDPRYISFPMGSDIFKVPGGGLNFVHGGSSPQELIVPVIDVKVDRGRVDTKKAEITLISTNKVTSLTTNLEFIQPEPVSDVIKSASYRICLVSADGEVISNEHIYVADKSDPETTNRMFRLRFTLKNRHYSPHEIYYLVAYDEQTGLEVKRREMVIDIAFVNDLGF